MRILRNLVASTALAAAIAAPAQAQDYRFTIPVQVSKLPSDVKTLSVMCEVGTVNSADQSIRSFGKATSVPQAVDATGAFSGEVTVAVSTPGFNPAAVMGPMYWCRLFFTAINPVSKASFDYFHSEDTALTPARSTVPPLPFPTAATPPAVLEAKGPIPR